MDPNETLKRLEFKVDKLDDRLDRIDTTLAAQHASLTEHIRRTVLLENQVVPLTAGAAMWAGAWKLVSVLGLVAGAAAALIKVLG